MKNDKTYTVPELVALCKGKSPEMIKKIIDIKTYAPINEKISILSNAIQQSSIKHQYLCDYDPIKINLNYIHAILTLYTNIDAGDALSYKDYDLLQEHHVLETIINIIGEDIDELTSLQDSLLSQAMRSNSLETTVALFLEDILELLTNTLNQATDKINSINYQGLINEFLKQHQSNS